MSREAGTPEVSFEAHLARQIVESERLRSAILAGLFGVLTLAFPLFVWIFHDDYMRVFPSYATVATAIGVSAGLVVYELLVRYVLGRGLRPPPALRFWNALIETSMPTALMLLVLREVDATAVLHGPAPYLYGVFIVLSTLRLEFALCVFTGLVAAVGFAAVTLAYTPAMTGAHLMKALVLVLSGLAAGFVAAQLRRRIGRAFRTAQTLGQQVSPEVAEALLRRHPPAKRFVCVMFMDIRGFTPLAEARTPEEIVQLQNEVFGVAIEVVNRHRGIINQFLGDGFMATFGAPLATGDDCRHAVAAARELVARITQVRIGIGLHAGEAVTGNIGTEARKQYSVTGNVVILAARIEQLNKEFGSQLLVSREVLERCGGEAAGAQPLGPVAVKGRAEPIELYRLA